MRVEFDPDQVWLVGGGLATPWTYGNLAAAAFGSRSSPSRGVAEALIALTYALRSGAEIDLGETTFTGEGTPLPVGGPPSPHERGRREFVLRGDTLVRLRTSGSTGSASLIQHRAADLWRSVRAGDQHRNDVWGFAFNPTHMAGVQVYLQALANGNTLVNLWGLARAEIVQRCARWNVTHLSATPTFYHMLLPLQEKLPAIRSISLGGERADASLMAELRSAYPRAKVRNIYASTEAGTLFVSSGDEFEVPIALCDRVRCADDRLWLHRSLLGEGSCAGEWHDTGDLVAVTSTEPLRFRIIGRAAGWINVGGEKVNPEEVESVIRSHSGVAAARVHGRKNSVTGNILAADVVVRGSTTVQDLNSYLEGRLLPHKRPRIIRFVDTLDLTRTGKVVRHG